MTKLDLTKTHRDLYRAKAEPGLVEIPEMAYLMIDGRGDPNTSVEYRDSVSALFSVAYKFKFLTKREAGFDFKVMPLEGLWWVDEGEEFSLDDKSNWSWTMLVALPDDLDPAHLDAARLEVATRKGLVAASRVRMERWEEGAAAQLLHLGPYAEEESSIERLHAFIRDTACGFRGRHHEIYLNDPSRVAPERLKTIVRQPVDTAPQG